MKNCALVTGGASGLGRAYLVALAEQGYNIVGVSKPGDPIAEVVQSIAAENGVQGLAMELDLSTDGCAKEMKQWCDERQAEVVFLVNNVGVGGTSEFEVSTHEANRLMLNLNIRTTVEMCREFLPDMVNRRQGMVLNVASMAANFAMPYKSIYSASKAFVKSFSIGLRSEMKRYGIAVSVVQPGAMRTNEVVIEQLKHGSTLSRLSAMDPLDVARFSIEQTHRGKAVITPGLKNWITLGILRVFPRPLKTGLAVFNYLRTKHKSSQA